MVASSEQQSAPIIVSKPAMIHASSSQPGAPLNRADSAEVMKIPEPIIDPMTIMVASIGPSARTRPDGDGGSLTFNVAVRESQHRLSPTANATRARIRPRPECRRGRKRSPRERRPPHCRRNELFLRATYG